MISDSHETKYFNINHASVPVWIYGDPKKPLIYFIHGYFRGFSDYIGDLPMRYLMKNYCVIAFDLPGFGYLKDFKKDRVTFIAEIIEKTSNGRRFVLFGTSYGALLALKYVYNYPDKVKGIILAGMPFFYGIRKVLTFSKVPFANKLKVSSVLSEFKFLNSDNLAHINTPVLLLYSSKDRQATKKMGEKVKRLIPKPELFTINKNNHSWLLHRVDESGFLEVIERFIKSLK